MIVSGTTTGAAVDLEELRLVRQAVAGTPLFVGSGVTSDQINNLLSVADGVIVGTWLKKEGDVRGAVDPDRVRQLLAAIE